jgi:general secretion pathway protein G
MLLEKIKKQKKTRGFTLIELMVVVAILGVLGLVVAQNIFPYFSQSQVTVVKTNIETLKNTVDKYRLNNKGRLPNSLEDLLQPDEFNMNEPYLEKSEAIIDPWGNPYTFIVTGKKFEIISFGSDSLEGGESDAADISSLGDKSSSSGYGY